MILDAGSGHLSRHFVQLGRGGLVVDGPAGKFAGTFIVNEKNQKR